MILRRRSTPLTPPTTDQRPGPVPGPGARSPYHDPPAASVLAAGAGSRVVIVTRDNCSLCAEAEATAARLGVDAVLLNVDSDPELLRRYTDFVPVTFVDGQMMSMWVLDADRLTATLASGLPDS